MRKESIPGKGRETKKMWRKWAELRDEVSSLRNTRKLVSLDGRVHDRV